ncbi:phage integrase family protein [Caballeronia sordidicola]|uniref:phage integrase family protein n=1 Tax=Caballeronia sordidicola TaxID=196367 RepID=UPI00068BA400|nr:phage integrase family protein [Caballeronia sordidicola]
MPAALPTSSVRNPENRSSIKRLTREHFALYRGYLDGVSVEQLHATYGDATTDIRATRRLIGLLRDTLSGAARRTRDVEATHLLRLRPGSIPDAQRLAVSEMPTLEAFRESVDPNGFHSEAELLELYQAEFPQENSLGVDRRSTRNARLRRRQIDALARMEASLVQAPQADHPVASWLEPAIAGRLQHTGIHTLADLLGYIEQRGHRWYASVARVGPKAARRIVDWLALHADSLRHTLSKRALTPRRRLSSGDPALLRPRQNGIVPIESLAVPAEMDGSAGTNRARNRSLPCSLGTDLQAIDAWLATPQLSPHTARAYRREAERLLLWAINEKKKALSSLDGADCAGYIGTFLADPQPAARWVGRAKIERTHLDWRPFIGALSNRSRETARAILHAMGQWLVAQNYWAHNPFSAAPAVAIGARIDVSGRSLDHGQWQSVVQAASRDRYSQRELRDYLALNLAYSTGLRRAELADATTGRLIRPAAEDEPDGASTIAWQLAIPGKGPAARTIPVPQAIMQLVFENLRARGLPGDPAACPADTPLLAHFRTGNSLTPDGMGQVFRRLFSWAALLSTPQNLLDSRRYFNASTHWVRHTHSHHALESGMDCREVQVRLGHANLSTTRLYVKARRHGSLADGRTGVVSSR